MNSQPNRDQLERAVHHICRNSGARVGPGFFSAITEDLAELLCCDFAFVGELVEKRDAVQTIAIWGPEGAVEPFRYELRDTPCAVVLDSGSCVYPDRVADLFPRDELLAKMGIRGYLGLSFRDAEDSPFGIVVCLYRAPIEDEDFGVSLLSLFGGRIGSELERLRAKRRADEFEARATRAQRLESLGVLAGGLAHDFNNILATVLSSADLAGLELQPGHPAREHLGRIRLASSTAGELCRQLLAYAGRGSFQIECAHLTSLVRDQVRLLHTTLGDDVELELELSDDPGALVDVDRSQINQLVLNLLINASEAIQGSGRSGRVKVATGLRDCGAEDLRTSYLQADVPPGTYVFLEVSDDGPGMSDEVKARLFDPFFTTKFAGRGLGLAAILGIVKGHQGTIRVESEVGRGSSFQVLLPLSQVAAVQDSRPALGDWSGSGQALFVDDNDLLRAVGKQMLAAIGFDPIVAEDGIAALEIVEARGPELVLVVLDLSMPRLSGEETFEAIRERYPELPVILSSGYSEQDTAQRFVGQSLAGFLQKPFRIEDLRQCAYEALTS